MHSINTRKIILISKNFKQAGYVEDNTRFKKRMKKKKNRKEIKKVPTLRYRYAHHIPRC